MIPESIILTVLTLGQTSRQLKVLAELPKDTSPTQKALIYAIKMAPEKPRSTRGSMTLVPWAIDQANRQARLQKQGHHGWNRRFQFINKELPAGYQAVEICAESWPNENMLEAAFEIVHSWRRSPGHWKQVMKHHDYWGYDMSKGMNGIWYGCGIFGDKR